MSTLQRTKFRYPVRILKAFPVLATSMLIRVSCIKSFLNLQYEFISLPLIYIYIFLKSHTINHLLLGVSTGNSILKAILFLSVLLCILNTLSIRILLLLFPYINPLGCTLYSPYELPSTYFRITYFM